MTKTDLKNFMVVELRNGKRFLVNMEKKQLAGVDCWASLDTYEDDLTNNYRALDIMYIYSPKSYQLVSFINHDCAIKDVDLLWDRNESATEMTVSEIEKKLGVKNLKIVKENGELCIVK